MGQDGCSSSEGHSSKNKSRRPLRLNIAYAPLAWMGASGLLILLFGSEVLVQCGSGCTYRPSTMPSSHFKKPQQQTPNDFRLKPELHPCLPAPSRPGFTVILPYFSKPFSVSCCFAKGPAQTLVTKEMVRWSPVEHRSVCPQHT